MAIWVRNSALTFACISASRSLGILSLFCIVPAVNTFQIFRATQTAQFGSVPTDVTGAQFLVYLLQNVTNLRLDQLQTSAPEGESLWRLETLSQLFSFIHYAIAGRFLSPSATVYSFVALGWVATGLIAYLVARELGAKRPVSSLVGVAVQLLPVIAWVSQYWLTYVWLAVPLFSLLMAIRAVRMWTRLRGALLVLSVVFPLFFDLYWFYFSLVIVSTFALANIRSPVWRRFAIVLLSFWAGAVTLPRVVRAIDPQSGLSTLLYNFAPTSLDVLTTYGAVPLDYVTPGPWHPVMSTPSRLSHLAWEVNPAMYTGAIVVALGVGRLLFLRKRPIDSVRVATYASAGVLFAFSLKPVYAGIPLPSYLISLAFPGLQYQFRASYVASAVLVILAGMAIQDLISTRLVATSIGAPLALLVIADLWLAKPELFVVDHRVNWSGIAQELRERDDTLVSVLPPSVNSHRSLTEQVFLEVKFSNGLYSPSEADRIFSDPLLNVCRKIQAVRALGVTHLLHYTGEAGSEWTKGEIVGSGMADLLRTTRYWGSGPELEEVDLYVLRDGKTC